MTVLAMAITLPPTSRLAPFLELHLVRRGHACRNNLILYTIGLAPLTDSLGYRGNCYRIRKTLTIVNASVASISFANRAKKGALHMTTSFVPQSSAVVFGLLVVFFPGQAMLSLILLFAAYMVLDGISSLIAAVRAIRAQHDWGLLLLQAAASLITAAVAIFWPAITMVVFVLITAAWAIVSGCLMLASAFRLTEKKQWWLVASGGLSLLYGILTIIAPLIGALVLTWWIGAYALVLGVFLIMLSLSLRSRYLRTDGATVLV
jgi:uncharacterized membrane protein HdeD (DUF308 family)